MRWEKCPKKSGYNDKLVDVNLRWWPKYQPLEQRGIASLNSTHLLYFIERVQPNPRGKHFFYVKERNVKKLN